MMPSCLVVTVVQFGNLAFLETSKKFTKNGQGGCRPQAWMADAIFGDWVVVGPWHWGSAGHAHGWGPRPGGATLQLAELGNQEIAGVFQEVSMQQWARPNGPRANKMFAGP